ncbi:MAG: Fur family transcriptional regulator [Anaerococcus hydrogenalis]|nr:Fur family transcriptional regulator [Anaerococcus hydrogenalis]
MNIEQLKKIYKKNGHKFTKQRQIIFNALKNSNSKHLTPEELFSIVHQENKQVGIATVYRTLNIFEDLGIVNKQEFTDSINTYELISQDDEHHDHLICKNCGKIVEEKILDNNDLSKLLKDKYNFQLDYYSLRIYGFCSECKEDIRSKNENAK